MLQSLIINNTKWYPLWLYNVPLQISNSWDLWLNKKINLNKKLFGVHLFMGDTVPTPIDIYLRLKIGERPSVRTLI